MSTLFGLPDIVPLGAGIELVDENDPAVTPRFLAIEASSMGEATRIIRKYHDYRMWHQLQSLSSHPEGMPADDGGDLASKIQKHYRNNDDKSGFGASVESVTLTFPMAAQSKVTEQLSGFPPRLSLVPGSPLPGSSKSVHVHDRAGSKSLPVLEQPLDIEVSDTSTSIFVCLNNPAKPGWMVVAPHNKPPMLFKRNLRVVGTNDISEKAAWDQVCSWLESRRFTVSVKTYPEGQNSFPDFRAWIDGFEVDVEMTSVPDMTAWTLKGTFHKLEKRISDIAKQPGQTRGEVIDEFLRKCSDKRRCMENAAIGGHRRPCMLVMSNWSAHALAAESSLFAAELSFFDVVMLIESDEVYCISGPVIEALGHPDAQAVGGVPASALEFSRTGGFVLSQWPVRLR